MSCIIYIYIYMYIYIHTLRSVHLGLMLFWNGHAWKHLETLDLKHLGVWWVLDPAPAVRLLFLQGWLWCFNAMSFEQCGLGKYLMTMNMPMPWRMNWVGSIWNMAKTQNFVSDSKSPGRTSVASPARNAVRSRTISTARPSIAELKTVVRGPRREKLAKDRREDLWSVYLVDPTYGGFSVQSSCDTVPL